MRNGWNNAPIRSAEGQLKISGLLKAGFLCWSALLFLLMAAVGCQGGGAQGEYRDFSLGAFESRLADRDESHRISGELVIRYHRTNSAIEAELRRESGRVREWALKEISAREKTAVDDLVEREYLCGELCRRLNLILRKGKADKVIIKGPVIL